MQMHLHFSGKKENTQKHHHWWKEALGWGLPGNSGAIRKVAIMPKKG